MKKFRGRTLRKFRMIFPEFSPEIPWFREKSTEILDENFEKNTVIYKKFRGISVEFFLNIRIFLKNCKGNFRGVSGWKLHGK